MAPIQINTPDDPLHQKIQELLPWYANGTLSSVEVAQVTSHVNECPSCRDALEQCCLLANAVKDTDETTWIPPATHFSELMQRVDAAEALRTKPHGWSARVQAWLAGLSAAPRIAHWALGMQGALIMVLGISLAWLLVPTGGNVYETMSSASPGVVSQQMALKIVFSDDISGAELRSLLHKLNANIVAGPSAIGVYTVHVPGRADSPGAAQTVQTLRAHPKIQFVEQIHP